MRTPGEIATAIEAEAGNLAPFTNFDARESQIVHGLLAKAAREARAEALAELTEAREELRLKRRSNAKLANQYVEAERSRQDALRKLAECEGTKDE